MNSRNNIVVNFAKNLNTAANSVTTPLTNIATNVANAITGKNNGEFKINIPNSSAGIDNKIYVWVLVIGGILGIVWLIKRFIVDANPDMFDSWIAMFRSEQQKGIPGAMAPPILPPSRDGGAAVHPDTEAWCFVGEDVTGRYCVKVPSDGSCEAGRAYKSRQDCEMVPAQHLPASLVVKQGAGALPLLSGN